MVDYKSIADYFIDTWCDLFSVNNCIERLLDIGVTKEQLLEMQFDENDIENVIEEIKELMKGMDNKMNKEIIVSKLSYVICDNCWCDDDLSYEEQCDACNGCYGANLLKRYGCDIDKYVHSDYADQEIIHIELEPMDDDLIISTIKEFWCDDCMFDEKCERCVFGAVLKEMEK